MQDLGMSLGMSMFQVLKIQEFSYRVTASIGCQQAAGSPTSDPRARRSFHRTLGEKTSPPYSKKKEEIPSEEGDPETTGARRCGSERNKPLVLGSLPGPGKLSSANPARDPTVL